LLFFGSRVSALIYQVLWTRVLGWVFGVTVASATSRVIVSAAPTWMLGIIVLTSPDPFQQFIEQRFRGDHIVWIGE